MTQLELEAFLTVVRTGSITAAARQLYITQPALSRRLHALEEELGYPLLRRGKGIRVAELTEEGRAFVPLAEKYHALWREARAIPAEQRQILHLSSVGSVSAYLLPEVFSAFMGACPDCSLQFHHQHSLEAYAHVAQGNVDLALISDDMFSREVQTIPLFREEMVLALSPGTSYQAVCHPSQLDGKDEIRLPWNPEYDLWHDFWFPPTQPPRVLLDQMSLLEYFLRQRNLWAVLPASAAARMEVIPGVRILRLQEGPPERYIYYLVKKPELSPVLNRFLELLDEKLRRTEGIVSLL